MTGPVVYVAHPQSTYGTSWEAECLQAIANALPDAELVNPRDLFESNDEWKRRGPIVIADVDMVVVFADACSWVGLGVMTEMALAVAHGRPVLFLSLRNGVLCTNAGIREPHDRPFPTTPQATMLMFRRYARLHPDLTSAIQPLGREES